MIRLILSVIVLASAVTAPLAAQGFAGLGTRSENFATPQPDPAFDFPADHGAHPAYRIEWWYLTAVLEDEDGAPTARNGRCFAPPWSRARAKAGPRRSCGWAMPQ
jgi:predicted secreted hydrolase